MADDDDDGQVGDVTSPADAVERRQRIEAAVALVLLFAMRRGMARSRRLVETAGPYLTAAELSDVWAAAISDGVDNVLAGQPGMAQAVRAAIAAGALPYDPAADVYQTVADIRDVAAHNGWPPDETSDAIRRALTVAAAGATAAGTTIVGGKSTGAALAGLGLRPASGDGLFAGPSLTPGDIGALLAARSRAWTGRVAERAQAIATRSHSAIAQQQIRLLGLPYQTWRCLHDGRTREAHLEADWQTVAVGEPFTVGGEWLDYPGDPTGSPGNIINCRCVLIGAATAAG